MHIVVTDRIRGQLELQWNKYSRFTPSAIMGIRVLVARCCFTVPSASQLTTGRTLQYYFCSIPIFLMSCANRQEQPNLKVRISTKNYSKHRCKGGLAQIKGYYINAVLSTCMHRSYSILYAALLL